MAYKANISENSRRLNCISIGRKPIRENKLESGLITIVLKNNQEDPISIESNYNQDNGLLSGLSKLYKLGVFDGIHEIDYEIITTKKIEIITNKAISEITQSQPENKYETVFERKNLKYLHIEPFRPENLKNWIPQTETDIYMIFGIVETYTDFKYCCGTNIQLLKDLGIKCDTDDPSKPDAILINRNTNEYMIAEFKMKSSAFKSNHKKEDIDVLVVWEDDERDKSILPKYIIVLSEITKNAAIDSLSEEPI
jgi:hypothetical protein